MSVTSVKKLFVRDLSIAIFCRSYSFAFESPLNPRSATRGVSLDSFERSLNA